MSTAATIPVRLSDDILAGLDGYAGKLGISRSAAIRLCLAYQLGVILTANPIELRALDARYARSAEIPSAEHGKPASVRHDTANKSASASGRPQSAKESLATSGQAKAIRANRHPRVKSTGTADRKSD